MRLNLEFLILTNQFYILYLCFTVGGRSPRAAGGGLQTDAGHSRQEVEQNQQPCPLHDKGRDRAAAEALGGQECGGFAA